MIRVVVEDLAFVEADAVVRPANEHLEPATPAGVRLDRLAGEAFTRQCRVQQPLDAGSAVVTAGGALSSPFVVHLVVLTRDRAVSAAAVELALAGLWRRAAEWALNTIAAPLIGAGPGGLPREEAARLLADTFRRSGAAEAGRELTIVVESGQERAEVEAVLGGQPA